VRYHHDSQFTAPADAGKPLSREHRRVIGAQLELHRRQRHMSPLHVEVIETLVRLRQRFAEGQWLFPSQGYLAELVGCCEKTVSTALRRANQYGLVSWIRRLVRKGATVRQTSNVYTLHPGTAKPVPRCTRKTFLEAPSPRIIDSPVEAVPSGAGDDWWHQMAAAMAAKARCVV
jgi:hypothetical protein